jgi:hypothetical protein
VSAVLALLAARKEGATVFIRDGRLVVRSAGTLPPEVLAGLRNHRHRLVDMLSLQPSKPPLCELCGRAQHEADYVCPTPPPADLRYPIAAGYHVPLRAQEAA